MAGASGRMGRMLIEAVLRSGDCALGRRARRGRQPGARAGRRRPSLGRASGVRITADLRAGLAGADVLIDFTRPEGTLAHLAVCRELGVKRGHRHHRLQRRAEGADRRRTREHIAIVMAPNMSVGVNVVLKLLDMAARALAEGYDIEIIEAHHRHKVDAPSGTALEMGEVVAARAAAAT